MKNNHDEVTKNEVKSPEDSLTPPRTSYTLEIMRVLWGYQKPATMKLIQNQTGYSYSRVKSCIKYLTDLHAITKEYYQEKERYHDPPHKHVLISLNPRQRKTAWRYLKKYGLL